MLGVTRASHPPSAPGPGIPRTLRKKRAAKCVSVMREGWILKGKREKGKGKSRRIYWTAVIDLLGFLPHRPPMRLIELVTELVAGDRASGGRRASPTDFYFDGHFPGDPVVPAIILVEMLAQIGGLAAAAAPSGVETGERLRLRVAGLGPFKFPRAARPGAWLEARARIAGRLGAMYKIEGDVKADDELVAVGSVTLAAVPKPRP